MASVQEQQEPTVRFSEAIRTASWALHGSAEGSSFMQDLLERRVDRSRYAQLVGQLYAVYSLLEEAGQAMRDHPAAAPFVREELNRMAALEADLRFFFGQDWPPQIQPNEGTQAYCDRLREVCFSWPGGFVAHHYTRYMGDLSGGQMIAKAVERSYDLQERRGTQFYVFDRIGDLSAFKNQYRANLDAGPWDDAEKQRIVEEVLLAYRLNARLLAAL